MIVVANKTAFFEAGQRNEPGKKSLAFMVILNDMTSLMHIGLDELGKVAGKTECLQMTQRSAEGGELLLPSRKFL